MAFLVQNAFNGSLEVQKANNYPHIRLYTTKKTMADKPLEDLPAPELPWSVASNVSISQNNRNDDSWLYFSATCWFFAVNVYERTQRPLGLISTNWGGTTVEAWSSPASLALCNDTTASIDANPGPSTLYNGMVHALMNSTIRGIVFYQGICLILICFYLFYNEFFFPISRSHTPRRGECKRPHNVQLHLPCPHSRLPRQMVSGHARPYLSIVPVRICTVGQRG